MIALTGDLGSASVLVASVPTVLVNAKHSREFEREADDYAYAWLDRNHIARKHFAAILQRLENANPDAGDDVGGWLSTHPRTADRLRE
jgi:Zn-dependent protease with chaperone function